MMEANRKLAIPPWHDAKREAPLKDQVVAVEFENGTFGLASIRARRKNKGWRSLLWSCEMKVKRWRQINVEDLTDLEIAMLEVLSGLDKQRQGVIL